MPKEVLRVQKITKTFGAFKALDAVDLTVHKGSIHALFGKNGAGKTVLMSIISGMQAPDSGSIILDGEPLRYGEVHKKQGLGIRIINQGINLVPTMSVVDNLFLGEWAMRRGGLLLDKEQQRRRAREIFRQLQVEMDLDVQAGSLDLNLQKLVEVAKASLWDCRVLILDETTSFLSEAEKRGLYAVMRRAAGNGAGVIFITHDLGEVNQVADVLTIIQDGRIRETVFRKDFNQHYLMGAMSSGQFVNRYPRIERQKGQKLLEVVDLSVKRQLYNVSFSLHGGEILGVTGMAASGRTALAEVVAGARQPDGGGVFALGDVRRPWRQGGGEVTYMPGVVNEGLVPAMGISQNITLGHLDGITIHKVLLDSALESQIARDYAQRLGFADVPERRKVRELSGGTAQKVLIAKGLYSRARVYVFNEPTSSLDVASKVEEYNLMNELIMQQCAVMVVSSNIEEIVGMCHRVLVLYRGRVVKELADGEINEKNILYYSSGSSGMD